MRGKVERGQERKSRGNQMGQKRRKSLGLSPFKDPRVTREGNNQ